MSRGGNHGGGRKPLPEEEKRKGFMIYLPLKKRKWLDKQPGSRGRVVEKMIDEKIKGE